MSQLQISTSFNIELGFELAPLHKRIIACLLDSFVMYVYAFVALAAISSSFSEVFNGTTDADIILLFLIAIPFLFYHLLSEILMNGESIGKRMMGLKIISLDGNSASISQYALRWFLRPIDFMFTSYLGGLICAAATKNGQRLGDLAAGTTVVSKKLPYQINQTIFKEVSVENYTVSFPQVMKLSDRDINTINTIVNQYQQNKSKIYVDTIAEKVKTVLDIQTQEDPIYFLEILLRDYNYLSQKK
jgi:uncharacterized RDD family membrane protein YckC